MATKKVTVREVFEALEKNGFDLSREAWLHWDGNKIVAGCVLAQTAINLGVVPNNSYDDGLAEILDYAGFIELDETPGYHEGIACTLHNQLNKFATPKKWATDKDSNAYQAALSKCASAIEHWNDKGTWNDTDTEYHWFLKTYAEVAAMAKEILEPYFDEEITLQVFDYNPFLAPEHAQV